MTLEGEELRTERTEVDGEDNKMKYKKEEEEEEMKKGAERAEQDEKETEHSQRGPVRKSRRCRLPGSEFESTRNQIIFVLTNNLENPLQRKK